MAFQLHHADGRFHPSLHETIATLAAQDPRETDSIAGLARWAGVRFSDRRGSRRGGTHTLGCRAGAAIAVAHIAGGQRTPSAD